MKRDEGTSGRSEEPGRLGAAAPWAALPADGAARIQLAVEGAGLATWDDDPVGRAFHWNEAGRALIGMGPDDEASEERFLERVHPEDRPRVVASVAAALDPGIRAPYDVECRVVRRDGSVRWLSARGRAYFEDDGATARVRRFVGVAMDVTERREAEARAQAALAREKIARVEAEEARSLVDALLARSPVGFCFLDTELRYVKINEALARMNGLPVEAHLGRRPSEVLPGLAESEAALRAALETETPVVDREVKGTTPAAPGEVRHWLASYYPVRVPGGGLRGAACMIVEITDRKRAEEALARREAELRALQSVTDVAISATEQGPLAEELLARACAALGSDCAAALAYDSKRGTLSPFATLGGYLGLELGREFPLAESTFATELLARGAPLAIEDVDPASRAFGLGIRSVVGAPLQVEGRIMGLVAVGSRTRRRWTEEESRLLGLVADRAARGVERARLHEEVVDAVASREQFLAVVSHDLRGPLGAIQMTASLLARLAPPDAFGDRVRRGSDSIVRSTKRMASLLTDLVDAAAIDAGRLAVSVKPNDARLLLDEARDELEPFALEKRVTLSAESEAREVPVLCDRERTLQVLSNLVTNAIKFTAMGGGGDVKRVVARVERRGGEVLVAIEDTGPGIAPENLPRLFERFWRERAEGRAGSGLGLFIARALVEAQGGRIWAESAPGRGAAFRFTLPAPAEARGSGRAAA